MNRHDKFERRKPMARWICFVHSRTSSIVHNPQQTQENHGSRSLSQDEKTKATHMSSYVTSVWSGYVWAPCRDPGPTRDRIPGLNFMTRSTSYYPLTTTTKSSTPILRCTYTMVATSRGATQTTYSFVTFCVIEFISSVLFFFDFVYCFSLVCHPSSPCRTRTALIFWGKSI